MRVWLLGLVGAHVGRSSRDNRERVFFRVMFVYFWPLKDDVTQPLLQFPLLVLFARHSIITARHLVLTLDVTLCLLTADFPSLACAYFYSGL